MALTIRTGPLLDGNGGTPRDTATLRVEEGRIAAIGEDVGQRDDEVLDLTHLTVLPGLIDAHTHMGVINVADPGEWPLAVTAAHLFRNAQLCLDSGHTTAREVGGADGGLKRAIDQGLVRGPRLLPSGPLLCQTGGHGHFGPPFLHHHHHPPYLGTPGVSQLSQVCDGPTEVRIAARRAFRHGATQIKVCVSGGVVSLTDSLDDTQFTVEELSAAVEEARARGTYVTAHAHNAQSVLMGIEAGLECFEHGTFLDEQTVARMVEAKVNLVPTLAVTAVMADDAEAWGIPEEVLPRLAGVQQAMEASLKMAHDAGVPVGSGTDLLGPDQNRRGLELGLKAKVIGADAAIVSATRTNARILRIDDEVGTLEVGKVADLIAVDFDPLAHPDLFDDPSRVRVVVKAGEVVKDLERSTVEG